MANPYYSNHSNNNHIFSLPKYLKYLISQHSRLTGAVRLPPFTILQISSQHQPWQSAQADGWSFDNLERLVDRNKVHHFPWGAMEMRLKNCGSHCWHNVRIQRLIGMPSPRGKRWILFLSASCHNLPPTIRLPPISLGNLQKVLYNIILTHYII